MNERVSRRWPASAVNTEIEPPARTSEPSNRSIDSGTTGKKPRRTTVGLPVLSIEMWIEIKNLIWAAGEELEKQAQVTRTAGETHSWRECIDIKEPVSAN